MYGKININKKEQIKKQDGCKKSVMVRCRLPEPETNYPHEAVTQ